MNLPPRLIYPCLCLNTSYPCSTPQPTALSAFKRVWTPDAPDALSAPAPATCTIAQKKVRKTKTKARVRLHSVGPWVKRIPYLTQPAGSWAARSFFSMFIATSFFEFLRSDPGFGFQQFI